MPHAPGCPHCGGKSIGWGWYKRLLRLGALVEPFAGFLVKRFRCKSCGRTFSLLPGFALLLKRYAAGIIQGAWEEHVGKEPRTLEEIVRQWELPCEKTVQRWLSPLKVKGEFLKRELRECLPYPPPGRPEPAAAAAAGDELLELARRVANSTPCCPFDRFRVPYHFVLRLL